MQPRLADEDAKKWGITTGRNSVRPTSALKDPMRLIGGERGYRRGIQERGGSFRLEPSTYGGFRKFRSVGGWAYRNFMGTRTVQGNRGKINGMWLMKKKGSFGGL